MTEVRRGPKLIRSRLSADRRRKVVKIAYGPVVHCCHTFTMPRHSAKTAHVGLAGAQAGAQASYGATTSSDTASQGSETGDAAGAGPGTGEKQFKSFRETWILCLGLWIM